MSTTVRVSDETHARLVTLAELTGWRMQAIVEEAVAAYEANVFWDQFNAGYERLFEPAGKWADVQAERDGEASALAEDVGGS